MRKRTTMRKQRNTYGIVAGLGLSLAIVVGTLNVQAQSQDNISIQSTRDYIEAEQLIDAIANELYKAHQTYPYFKYDIEYQNDRLLAVTVSGIDNHTIANRIANQIIILEDVGRAVSNMNMDLLPAIPEMGLNNLLNEQQADAYQPSVKVDNGFNNVLFTSR